MSCTLRTDIVLLYCDLQDIFSCVLVCVVPMPTLSGVLSLTFYQWLGNSRKLFKVMRVVSKTEAGHHLTGNSIILKIHYTFKCWGWSSNTWPPDVKSQLIGRDPDAGKDRRREEKGMAEDEMVGWHHWLNGHEFEQAPEDGEGQWSLVRCSPWGHKESDTSEQLNTTTTFK